MRVARALSISGVLWIRVEVFFLGTRRYHPIYTLFLVSFFIMIVTMFFFYSTIYCSVIHAYTLLLIVSSMYLALHVYACTFIGFLYIDLLLAAFVHFKRRLLHYLNYWMEGESKLFLVLDPVFRATTVLC